eukprot:gene5524-5759_t
MYRILANSYLDPATSGNGPTLGELLVQAMANGNQLATRRAAALAAALAPAVDWQGHSTLWVATFQAGQQLLLVGTSAGGNGSSSKNRTSAALLLRQLIGRCPDMTHAAAAPVDNAAGGGAGSMASGLLMSPMLFSLVMPVLEHLAATKQGSRQLQHAVQQLQQQLLTLG